MQPPHAPRLATPQAATPRAAAIDIGNHKLKANHGVCGIARHRSLTQYGNEPSKSFPTSAEVRYQPLPAR
jgi:hypothetical protein